MASVRRRRGRTIVRLECNYDISRAVRVTINLSILLIANRSISLGRDTPRLELSTAGYHRTLQRNTDGIITLFPIGLFPDADTRCLLCVFEMISPRTAAVYFHARLRSTRKKGDKRKYCIAGRMPRNARGRQSPGLVPSKHRKIVSRVH